MITPKKIHISSPADWPATLRRAKQGLMDLTMKVLGPQDEAAVEALERGLLAARPGDEFEKEMSTWKAPWRKEALAHYLPQGWSFGIWDVEGRLLGYSLGQPLLFFQGFTQALWVEHMSARDESVYEKLIEISYRWARDKHLQRVLFPAGLVPASAVKIWDLKPLREDLLQLKSSKYGSTDE
jgi:hypothetical protein